MASVSFTTLTAAPEVQWFGPAWARRVAGALPTPPPATPLAPATPVTDSAEVHDFMMAVSTAIIFKDAASYVQVGTAKKGDVFAAFGPIVNFDGYFMVTIEGGRAIEARVLTEAPDDALQVPGTLKTIEIGRRRPKPTKTSIRSSYPHAALRRRIAAGEYRGTGVAACPAAECDVLGSGEPGASASSPLGMTEPMKPADGSCAFKNVCLVTSLQSLGVPLPVTASGPFRAMAHGNVMLAPYSKALVAADRPVTSDGRYVMWTGGHFVGVIIEDFLCTVNNGSRETKAGLTTVEVEGGKLCRWFRLVPVLSPEQQQRVSQNRCTALKRKAAALRQHEVCVPPAAASGLVRPLPPIGWAHPVLPDTPSDFLEMNVTFPDVIWLKSLNQHPRDHRLKFLSDTHRYLVDGAPTLGSVTGLIHAFCSEFNADAVIDRMVAGRNWPRPGYLKQTVDASILCRLRAFPEAHQLLRALESPLRNEDAICAAARAVRYSSTKVAAVVSELSLSPNEIVRMWWENKTRAAHAGTWMHFQFEAWLNRAVVSEDTVEMQLFLRLAKMLGGLTAYRTEWTIFGEEECLAGSIDFVAAESNDNLILFDWKRSKGLRGKYRNSFQQMAYPLSHLDDCAGNHYRLQLNCYRFMLEKYYSKTVSGMWVVCTHPDNGAEAFLDRVPFLQAETEAMMQYQRERARETRSMTSEDLAGDPLGGSDEEDGSMSFDTMLEEEQTMQRGMADEDEQRALQGLHDIFGEAESERADVPAPATSKSTAKRRRLDLPSCAASQLPSPPADDGDSTAGEENAGRYSSAHVGGAVAPFGSAASSARTGAQVAPSSSGAWASASGSGGGTTSTSVAQFLKWCSRGVPDVATIERDVGNDDDEIVHVLQRIRDLVEKRCPSQSADLKHIAVGALAVFRLRLVDISLREEVMLLHLIEGGSRIRAHNGVCHFYSADGSWSMYPGVIPQSTLARVKSYLLRLEGLFRAMDTDTERSEEKLIDAVFATCQRGGSTPAATLSKFEEIAIRCFGTGKGATKGNGKGGKGDDAGVEDAEPENSAPWTKHVAGTIGRLSAQLIRALLSERIIPYYVEWCDTPQDKCSGVCFKDTCLLFDVAGVAAVHVSKNPYRNVYVSIPHSLLDPVLDTATARVGSFYAQTFWGNTLAFECQLCALALALRGCNVDRAFWGIGPGGVGQSLFTTHLAAVVGRLHAFLDTNIYYSDDELRKQADNLVGRLIVTGQETVEGSSRKMREDLYKKHVSGDPVPARLPYGIVTKLIELPGWKRLELNTLVKFAGVTEANFNSIYRRGWVMQYKARFMDADYLNNSFPDHESVGVFRRDPTLKDFLKSGPAIAATLRKLWGFLMQHSYNDCVSTIESYVVRGGDGGLTKKSLRFCCGLAEQQPEAPAVEVAAPQPAPIEDSLVPVDADAAKMETQSAELLAHLLDSGREWLAAEAVNKLATLPSVAAIPMQDRPEILASLAARGLWKSIGKIKKAAACFIPVIRTDGTMEALCPMQPADADEAFPEWYDTQAACTYALDNTSREENVHTMMRHKKAELAALRPKKGKPSQEVGDQMEKLKEMLTKLTRQEEATQRLIEELKAHEEKPDARVRHEDCSGIVIRRTYRSKYESRGRRYVENTGAQTMPRALLKIACPWAVDWDIKNCAFSLLSQMFDRLKIKPVHPMLTFTAIRRCAAERENVCKDLGMSLGAGKNVLLQVLHGGSPPGACGSPAFIETLRKEGRLARWLASTQRSELYDSFRLDAEKRWPEATAFHYWWTPVEAYCVDAWLQFISSKETRHVSLHFDGVRVDRFRVEAEEDFKKASEEFILKKTGYVVELVEKNHDFFLALAAATASSSTSAKTPAVLLEQGNCIPCAIGNVLGDFGEVMEALAAKNPANLEASSRGVRKYRQWACVLTKHLLPSEGLTIEKAGLYLVHAENGGSPHCVAVRTCEDGACHLYDGGRSYVTSVRQLKDNLDAAVDRDTVLTFALLDAKEIKPEDPNLVLLDIMAGAVPMEDDSDSPLDDEPGGDDEAVVQVGEELQALLCKEVEYALSGMVLKRGGYRGKKQPTNRKGMKGKRVKQEVASSKHRCPLCPFRAFRERGQVKAHVCKYHKEAARHCPSGTKQLRIAVALYDNDTFCGLPLVASYLSRSAAILREQLKPALSCTKMAVDKDIRMVLRHDGPVFVNKDVLGGGFAVRRMGNSMYTMEFAEAVFKAGVIARAQMRSVASTVMLKCQESESELASLLPRGGSPWWNDALADVFFSPPVTKLLEGMVAECERRNEFFYLSLDGTVRCTLSLVGQPTYRTPRAKRSTFAVADADATYKVLTVRGCTGAVLALAPLNSEASEKVCAALKDRFSASQLAQVRHMASDAPSEKLLDALRTVCPRLESLQLDVCHLVMAYEQAQWRKKHLAVRGFVLSCTSSRRWILTRTVASGVPFTPAHHSMRQPRSIAC